MQNTSTLIIGSILVMAVIAVAIYFAIKAAFKLFKIDPDSITAAFAAIAAFVIGMATAYYIAF